MGTTVVAARVQGNRYEVAWVGDSRAYLWRWPAGPAQPGSQRGAGTGRAGQPDRRTGARASASQRGHPGPGRDRSGASERGHHQR
ncbi:hypothetical protein G6F35_018576 [Rhizopus arrhizus]|nr:hypothetical protein G6F35_018576 [Rhizopus arrhizus]